MADASYDVVVIGAGPGGYVAAIRAAQLGLKTAVVEKEYLGGVCLNVGCIPSKAMIEASKRYRHAKEGEAWGLIAKDIKVDVKQLQSYRQQSVDRLTGGVKQLLKGNKVDVHMGTATLLDKNTLEVDASDGKKKLQAKNIILATGSAPIEIPGFKFDEQRIVSSTGALELPEIPKKLLIVGGGVIGMEIGCLYANFGAEVTTVEMMEQLLPGIDKDAAKLLERLVKKRGFKVHLSAKAKKAEMKKGAVEVTFEADGKTHTDTYDRLLVAVGRKPNSKNLGLDKAGVAVDDKGFIHVNEQCQTSVPHIYAIGDVVKGQLLAHRASRMGIVAAEVCAGKASGFDQVVPGVIFTDPEIASVGLTEEQAKEQGIQVRVGRFPFSANGRAITASETDGFVKILANAESHVIVGIHIMGHEASDMISEAALAYEMGATLEDVALTIHPHPTFPEAVMEAAEHALGHAIHTANR